MISPAETEANRAAGTNTSSDTVRGTGEWPVVPPVPTPTPPPPAQLGPEPPIVNRGLRFIPSVTLSAVPASPAPDGPGVPPTSPLQPVLLRSWRVPSVGARAAVALRPRPLRRPIIVPSRGDNQVWQPRFAYTAAAVVAIAFTFVTLPLWLTVYGRAASPDAPLTEVLALGMMLLGAFLAAVTAWVVIVEMRARVRMVDTLGRTGEHEAPDTAQDAGYSGLLRPFIQVPAQLSLLAVALALFVGATLIAL